MYSILLSTIIGRPSAGTSESPLVQPQPHPVLVHGRQVSHHLAPLPRNLRIQDHALSRSPQALEHVQQLQARVLSGICILRLPAGFQLLDPLVQADDLELFIGEIFLDGRYQGGPLHDIRVFQVVVFGPSLCAVFPLVQAVGGDKLDDDHRQDINWHPCDGVLAAK
jgi:hypothetical protein